MRGDKNILNVGEGFKNERRHVILCADQPDVCLLYTSSELGTIQPVSEIAEILRDFPGCLLYTSVSERLVLLMISFKVSLFWDVVKKTAYGVDLVLF